MFDWSNNAGYQTKILFSVEGKWLYLSTTTRLSNGPRIPRKYFWIIHYSTSSLTFIVYNEFYVLYIVVLPILFLRKFHLQASSDIQIPCIMMPSPQPVSVPATGRKPQLLRACLCDVTEIFRRFLFFCTTGNFFGTFYYEGRGRYKIQLIYNA